MTRALAPRDLLVAAGLTTMLLLAGGCSSGGGSEADQAAGGVHQAATDPGAVPVPSGASQARGAADVPAAGADPGARGSVVDDVEQPAIISTGDVVLRSKDVDVARGEVIGVLDSVDGQLADERTTSDGLGHLTTSELVLRVPSATFATTVDRLGRIGTRVSSLTHSDDVTTKVVDVRSRLAVQRASVARIRLLLDRAQSIRDIVSIEGQLSRREATLESLEQQQAYLADQTSLSTIHVRLERVATTTPGPIDEASVSLDRHNFLGGLLAGAHALRGLGTGLAIVSGALLPWLVVLLVLGVPALVVTRRLRGRGRRRPTASPAP